MRRDTKEKDRDGSTYHQKRGNFVNEDPGLGLHQRNVGDDVRLIDEGAQLLSGNEWE